MTFRLLKLVGRARRHRLQILNLDIPVFRPCPMTEMSLLADEPLQLVA